MSLIAYISFAWMYSAFWCERKEDNTTYVNDGERGFFFGKKEKKRDQNHNTNSNSNTTTYLDRRDCLSPPRTFETRGRRRRRR